MINIHEEIRNLENKFAKQYKDINANLLKLTENNEVEGLIFENNKFFIFRNNKKYIPIWENETLNLFRKYLRDLEVELYSKLLENIKYHHVDFLYNIDGEYEEEEI